MDNGLVISFTYNGSARVGAIEKSGVSKNGHYITIKLADGSFKSFSVAKMNDVLQVVK